MDPSDTEIDELPEVWRERSNNDGLDEGRKWAFRLCAQELEEALADE